MVQRKRPCMQKLMQAMALFFQPQGAGGGHPDMQLVGMCGCGGMIQLARDMNLEPVRPEITCSSAIVQNCSVGLGPMPITATFREFEVCTHPLVLCFSDLPSIAMLPLIFSVESRFASLYNPNTVKLPSRADQCMHDCCSIGACSIAHSEGHRPYYDT